MRCSKMNFSKDGRSEAFTPAYSVAPDQVTSQNAIVQGIVLREWRLAAIQKADITATKRSFESAVRGSFRVLFLQYAWFLLLLPVE